MVDRDQWLAGSKRKRLRVGDPDQKSAGKPRPFGDGNRIETGKGQTGLNAGRLIHRSADHRDDVA